MEDGSSLKASIHRVITDVRLSYLIAFDAGLLETGWHESDVQLDSSFGLVGFKASTRLGFLKQ